VVLTNFSCAFLDISTVLVSPSMKCTFCFIIVSMLNSCTMLCVIAYVLDIGVCVLILYLNQCRKVKDKK